MKKTQPTLLLLYVLLGYVLVQFSWWTFLLYELNSEVVVLSFQEGDQPMNEQMQKKFFMIGGEGIVFLTLVLIGALYIRKFLMRQEKQTRQERNFLLATTHELNSPIAAIKLNLQTLKRTELSEDQRIQMVNSGIETVQRLENLVTNMLMASRLDSGRFSLATEKFQLSDLLNAIHQRFDPLLKQSKINLKINVDHGLSIVADKQAMEIVINNLIHNSIKYAPLSEIFISATVGLNSLLLQICDTGPGINNSDLKEIFKKFYRLENEETRSQKGTGLGLYLVSQLVELHGGSITAKSNSPSGLCIQLKLPQKT